MGTKHNLKALPMTAVVSLALVALSGCTDDATTDGNAAPVAALHVPEDTAWTDEALVFDAQAATDPDGDVTRWTFDFGDGKTMQVDNADEARVEHAYDQGGEYTVTVTVADDGGENGPTLTDAATHTVAINERHVLPSEALYALPAGNQSSTSTTEFATRTGIDGFRLELDIEGATLTGTSEIVVRLTGPGGVVVQEQVVEVDAGETEELRLDGDLDIVGDHAVELEANSGATLVSGQLLLYYDQGF
ncbi:MAG: PKD domain-containing protein [Thermoplasmatota archaeon]